MTIRLGWEAGVVGTKTFVGDGAAARAASAYPEVFGAIDAHAVSVEAERELLASMRARVEAVNDGPPAPGLGRFVLECAE